MGLTEIDLAIPGYRAQLAGQEVVGGPRAAHGDFAVLQLFGGRVVAVLVLLDALVVNQVSNIDQHALRSHLLAADLFLKRVKELVDLHRKSPGFGLAFPLAGGLFPKFREIITTDRVWQLDVDHGLAQRSVSHDQLDVHFGFAPEFRHALPEGAPVNPDGVAKGVVALENCAEFKGKDGGIAETGTDDSCVLDCGFLVQFSGCVVIFADDHGEFTTGIAENRGATNSLYTF